MGNIQGTDRLTLSVKEAGMLLGLSRGLMYEAIHTGRIPSVRVGRRILIPRAALERLLGNATTQNVAHGDPPTGV
jgi:excisionase family DNA binding protein